MVYCLRTSLIFGTAVADTDYEPSLILTYSVTPGYAPTWDDPGCDPSAELLTAYVHLEDGSKVALPEWMFGFLYGDEAFLNGLLDDAAERDECARDQAADAKREEQMLERGR